MKTSVQLVLAFAMVMLVRAQDPVNVGVYYETLCDGCQEFITTQLWPAYQKVPEIFTVDFVPFGGAYFFANGTSWNFICQHGPDECVGNKIESCALNYYPDNVDNVPFINCAESAEDPVKASEKCAYDNKLDWDEISICAYGDQGSQLLHDNGVKTKTFLPPITYVPWITINGVWTLDIGHEALDNFLKLVCDTYTGTRPDACPKVR